MTKTSKLMTERANALIKMLNLIKSVESYTLQNYRNTLFLSENLREFKNKSPYKPPFALNYLEYYDSHEPVTSWIIRHIFAYSYNGHHPFFESFASRFLTKIGFQMDWINHPVIDKDHEYKNIDILVRDTKYAIIIENKLKGADFQLNQIARYVATMREEGYSNKQIFVVILPKYDISNEQIRCSVWRLPLDWKSNNSARKCRVNDYTCWCDWDDCQSQNHCRNCKSLRELFKPRTILIHSDFSKWLYDSIYKNTLNLPEEELKKQFVLSSAVLQLVDFLNCQYQTRENNKYKMDIKNFLSDQLKLNELSTMEQILTIEDKIKDTEELKSRLYELLNLKSKTFIKEMRERYKVALLPTDKDGWYFDCKLSFDVYVIKVILGKEGRDYCQIEEESQSGLPEFITNDLEISAELNDSGNQPNTIWRYDTYEESLLRFDRVLGRLLELQKII